MEEMVTTHTVTMTAELMSNDTKFARVGESERKRRKPFSYTWSSFACGKENEEKEISTPVNESFLAEGHPRWVTLRSIVDELTLVCVLIIPSCIVEYSHVMNDLRSILNHFLFMKHTHIVNFYINTEISISYKLTPFYCLEIFKILWCHFSNDG